jgi:putative NIF3 family GTP cyclohydrolase 1 type 2
MKLSRFFKAAVDRGIEADPRLDRSAITGYADSAVLYGDPDTEVTNVLVGIDCGESELLLADRLRDRCGIDLVVSHHPSGTAYAGLYKVMELQVRLLERCGLSKASAREYLKERQGEVERKLHPQNHMRAVDAARLLDMPFCCLHTPADNCAASFVDALLKKSRPRTVADILRALGKVREYAAASAESTGPRILAGSPARPAGKIFVEMTGGASGPSAACESLREGGIRTLVSMHISDDYLRKARAAGLNSIVAGHISSDTLGMNLLLDAVEKVEPLTIIPCSGFRRFRRNA